MSQPLILVVNDDGIDSPGLLALVNALQGLGELLIVAPSQQQSGMGRSIPTANDGQLFARTLRLNGRAWSGYGANASPAQAAQYGLFELADRPPALVVSGINYGENVGVGIMRSGTVGAAFEAAEFGFPALAISYEVDITLHHSLDQSVDFSVAAHFARLFADRWLTAQRPPDVDVLKIDVPAAATIDTPWRITRLERGPYFVPVAPLRRSPGGAGRLGYMVNRKHVPAPDSDVAALRDGVVSVTPLTIDMTARTDAQVLQGLLDGNA
jgi:5'-nucleotidase